MRTALLLALIFALPAQAQVAADEHALDALAATPAPALPAPAAKPDQKRPSTPAVPRKVAPRLGPPPKIAAIAPANPVILPAPMVMPPHPAPLPPNIPVKEGAAGNATQIPDGVRIGFGAGSSDLNKTTLAAIERIAAEALAKPAMIISITAWAPGTADDPSTPRRLSLDRALAARAVLIHAGLASSRIRALAKGMAELGRSAPDQADILEVLPK